MYHIFPAHLGLGVQPGCHPGSLPYTLHGIFGTMYSSKIFSLLERDLILLAHCDTPSGELFPFSLFFSACHYFFSFKLKKKKTTKAFGLNESEGGMSKPLASNQREKP